MRHVPAQTAEISPPRPLRCAVYARVSVDDRQDSDMPSFEVQGQVKLPLEMGVLSFVQNVDKELRNGGKASTCGIHAGI